MVRFQFRTVLLPGRPAKSVAEHRRIVGAIAGHDRDAAQRAMLEHLMNVAAALAPSYAARSEATISSSVLATWDR